MAKKIDESKTYLEEGLSTQETNLKEFCNNLMEKLTSELTSKLETQAKELISSKMIRFIYKNRF